MVSIQRRRTVLGKLPLTIEMFFTLLIFLAFSFTATANEPTKQPSSYERPPILTLVHTEPSYALGRGNVQLSVSPSRFFNEDHNTSTLRVQSEYGLSDHWQVGLEWQSYKINDPDFAESTSGMSDIAAKTRYIWPNILPAVNVSADLEFGWPHGRRDLALSSGNRWIKVGSTWSYAINNRFNSSLSFGWMSVRAQQSESGQDGPHEFIDPDDIFDGLPKEEERGEGFVPLPETGRDNSGRSDNSWLDDNRSENNNTDKKGAYASIAGVWHQSKYAVALEFNWQRFALDANNYHEIQLSATPSFIWKLEDLEFLLSSPIGLNSETPDNALVLTVTSIWK